MKSFRLDKIEFVWEDTYTTGKKWNDKYVLLISFVCMIPLIGQGLWLLMLLDALCRRQKIYYVTGVKESKRVSK